MQLNRLVAVLFVVSSDIVVQVCCSESGLAEVVQAVVVDVSEVGYLGVLLSGVLEGTALVLLGILVLRVLL